MKVDEYFERKIVEMDDDAYELKNRLMKCYNTMNRCLAEYDSYDPVDYANRNLIDIYMAARSDLIAYRDILDNLIIKLNNEYASTKVETIEKNELKKFIEE